MRFSVIIVTWNGLPLLQQYLPSVAASLSERDELLIADNASTDETAAWLANHQPRARHVVFDRNYGYCGGNNRGARHATGDWLIFLNNDVETPPDWLDRLAGFLERHPGVHITQPVLRSWREPHLYEYAGASGGFLDTFGYPFCRGRVMDVLESADGTWPEPEAISWASGAALVIRKDVFEQLGGFEEAFEFHMEEIDLCWRAWRNGFHAAVCTDTAVYHLGGGSLATGSYRKWRYNFRNSLLMLVRNDQRTLWPLWLLVRMGLDGLAALQQVAAGNPVVLRAVWNAHMDFYRLLPQALRWRRALKTSAPHSMPFCSALVPIHFFLFKKRTFEAFAGRINRSRLL